MRLEHALGERLHHRHQDIGDGLGGVGHGRLRSAPGETDGLAGERHRGQGLADDVEEPVEELLAGHRVGSDETGGTHRTGEHLPRGPSKERPIEIEEGGGAGSVHAARLRLRPDRR